MKKTILIAVPMKERLELSVYTSDSKSLPTSDKPYAYPSCSFLDRTLEEGDQLNILLLMKQGPHCHSEKNAEILRKELTAAIGNRNIPVTYSAINTDFAQSRSVHTWLLGEIVNYLEDGSHILADVTYGPKDQPIIVFSALNFAEKFLDCRIEHILYGQATFVDGHVADTKLCDLSPLYGLSSVTSMIHCDQPGKARSMLKALLAQ